VKAHTVEGAVCVCGDPATHRVVIRVNLYGVEREAMVDRAACHRCAADAVRRIENRVHPVLPYPAR
jgi:hypothetical protein